MSSTPFAPLASRATGRARSSWSLVHGLAILAWLVLALPLLEVGVADNGDFWTRAGDVVSGPIGDQEQLCPEARYFRAWIPRWSIEQHWDWPGSSTKLLLHAAAASTRAFGSDVLDLRALGFTLRFASVLCALGLVFAIARREDRPLWWLGAAVLSVVVLHLDVEVQAFSASVYEFAGFLPLLFASLLALHRASCQPERIWRGIGAACAFLLVGFVQPQALPLLFFGAAYLLWRRLRQLRLRLRVPISVLVPALLAWLCLASSTTSSHFWQQRMQFNSIFYGALLHSQRPEAHLERLGFPAEARTWVGEPAFGVVGSAALETTAADQLSYLVPLRIYLTEPAAILHGMESVASAMHQPPQLGRTELQPGRGLAPGPEDAAIPTVYAGSRLWGRILPPGLWFWVFVACLGAALTWRLRRGACAVAKLSLLCLVSGTLSAAIAIFGDGDFELSRHLLYARVLFDLGFVLALLALLTWRPRRPAAEAGPSIVPIESRWQRTQSAPT